jgi:16S rRNA U516 pseudouridylate synthase RsuA-like enzyme
VKERIQKVLANAGVASRRSVEEMVQQALDMCTRRGVPCAAGAHSTAEAVRRAEQGFRMVLGPPEPGLAAAVRDSARGARR